MFGAFGGGEDGGNFGGEGCCIEAGFGQGDGGMRFGQATGVGGLMIAGCCGIGDQDRRAADHRDVGDRGGAGAGDDQLRLTQEAGDVGEERLHIGVQSACSIGGHHAGVILGAGLMGDAQEGFERIRQGRKCCGNHIGQDARPLGAADDDQAHRVIPWRDIRCGRTVEDRLADRVAGRFAGHTFGQLGGPGAAGDFGHPAGEKLIDPAQHTILFVDHARDMERPGGAEGGDGGIATEAYHDGGSVAAELPKCCEDASGDAERHHHAGNDAAAREGGRGEDDAFDLRREAIGIARPPCVGRKAHAPAFGDHCLSQRLGGEHVAAGAPCGDQENRRVVWHRGHLNAPA